MRGASYQSWNMKWISGPRKVRMNWGGMLVGCISISWLINPMNTIVTCRSHKPLLLDWTKSICVDFPFQPSIYGGTPMTMETPFFGPEFTTPGHSKVSELLSFEANKSHPSS